MTTSRKISSFSVIPFLFCNLLLLCHVNIKVPDFRLATHNRIRLPSGFLPSAPPLQISLSLSSHLLCPAELPLGIDYALLDKLQMLAPSALRKVLFFPHYTLVGYPLCKAEPWRTSSAPPCTLPCRSQVHL